MENLIIQKKKSLVTQEQISLLVNSECIKRYKNLPELLKDFKLKRKPIYKDDIEGLKETDSKLYSVLVYGFGELITEGAREWVQLGFIDTDNSTCELCGNTRLEYNFKIQNALNNKEMIVGSSCIDKFPKLNSNGVNIKKEKNARKRIDRIHIINSRYDNIRDILDSWKMFYKELPTLLPKDLDTRFKTLLYTSESFYNDFIGGKIPVKRLDEFNSFITEFSDLKFKSEYFYDANKSNRFLVNRPLINWLDRNKLKQLKTSIINKGGLIDSETAKEIYSLEFVNRFNSEIANLFETHNFEVVLITESMIIVSYKTVESITIKLHISLKEFMRSLFGTILNYTPISDKEILDRLVILWDENNVGNMITIVNKILRNSEYYFKKNYKEGVFDIFIIVEKSRTEFTELKGTVILKSIKGVIINDKSESKILIEEVLSKINNWKNINEEKQKYNQSDILAAMKG